MRSNRKDLALHAANADIDPRSFLRDRPLVRLLSCLTMRQRARVSIIYYILLLHTNFIYYYYILICIQLICLENGEKLKFLKSSLENYTLSLFVQYHSFMSIFIIIIYCSINLHAECLYELFHLKLHFRVYKSPPCLTLYNFIYLFRYLLFD